MITWTQGGTTKSINNNSIVYAKQGADGEPVLIDRIIAVDTSTNPPTESVVYQSNSILRANSVGSFYGPAAMNADGRCFWSRAEIRTVTNSQYDIYYTGDYRRVQYPPLNCPTTTTALKCTTKYRYNVNTGAIGQRTYRSSSGGSSWTAAGGTIGSYAQGCEASITGVYERQISMTITYTNAVPYRVVVKVRVGKNTIKPFIVGGNGYTPLLVSSTGNNTLTTEQVLYDGLMDSGTRNYTFNFDTRYSGMSWVPRWLDMQADERYRGGIYYDIPNVSRTIEIYDPDTGTLIASNTSALSTTWTARH